MTASPEPRGPARDARFRRPAGPPWRAALVVAVPLIQLVLLAGLLSGSNRQGEQPTALPEPSGVGPVRAQQLGQAMRVPRLPRQLPGIGPQLRSEIPDASSQVLVVTGAGENSPRSTVVLWQRTDEGWREGPAWPAHNALRGWTDDHRLDDLRSPTGVYTLSDAGGLLPDPGTELPYHRSDAFTIDGTGFLDEPLAGSFDYVVAIDYNRVPGRSPLDWTRPLGEDKGGGIWLHVDHQGPTRGCISLQRPHMKELLRRLDPDRSPVVVMGHPAALAR